MATLRRMPSPPRPPSVDALARVMADSGLPHAVCVELARQAVALMDGLQLQWLMRPDEVDMAADFAAWVETVRHRWGR